MRATKSSKASPRSSAAALLAVVVFLAALSAGAIAFFHARGWILYYGDAMAHLNIARRIVDSRTPGWEQVGTVWLPLPHAMMLPLVSRDDLWRTGLAGALPSGFCLVLAGTLFFLAARRLFASQAAAAAGLLLLVSNPNLLYLSSIPMSEAAALAGLAAVLYFTVLFRDSQSVWAAAAAGLASLAGTLSRYEAWFFVPFAAAFFFVTARRRRWLAASLYASIAALGPLYWLAHNLWYYGAALEFYSGPYSAKAIYQRAVDAGMARYPGDHDWWKAARQFGAAVRLCAGWPLVAIGAVGAAAALLRRAIWPVILLALPLVFYVLSIHSAATPIFVPHLWPNSYYNTRYALVALPLLALGGAALVSWAPGRARGPAAALLVAAAAVPWLAYPRAESWICWKESQVNSEARRAWTHQAAAALVARYGRGDGVFTSFGDLAGIFVEAGIPLRRVLHEGNGPHWLAALKRPDLFLWERWVVAISGDPVATAVTRTGKTGPRYDRVEAIAVKGAPVIEIYRRAPP